MFCSKCGKEVQPVQKFCGNCGEKIVHSAVESTTKPKSFPEFVRESGKARAVAFPKKRKLDRREVQETTIFASILFADLDGNLKQEKGTRLPIKVDVKWGSVKLKQAVFEKFQRYNKSVSGRKITDYKLVYKTGDLIRNIPGTSTEFTIKGYKEDLGVGYHAVVVYLMEYSTFSDGDSDNSDNDNNDLPRVLNSSMKPSSSSEETASTISTLSRRRATLTSSERTSTTSTVSRRVLTSTLTSSEGTSTASRESRRVLTSTLTSSEGTSTTPTVSSSRRSICPVCSCSYIGSICLICIQNAEFAASLAIDQSTPRESTPNTERDASVVNHDDHNYASAFQAAVDSGSDDGGDQSNQNDADVHSNNGDHVINASNDSGEVVLVKTVKLHRMNIRADLQRTFMEPGIENFELRVIMIDPRGNEEMGRGAGVVRDAFCNFFRDFYVSHMKGRLDKVPAVLPGMFVKEWSSLAKMVKYCVKNLNYFPLNMSIVFFTSVFFGDENISEEMLLASFKNYVSEEEKETITNMLANFDVEGLDDLLDMLSSFNCRRVPTEITLKDVLLEVAHSELIQKPRYMTNVFQKILCPNGQPPSEIPTLQSLKDLYSTRLPSAKKVIKAIKTSEQLTPQEQDTLNHLNRFLKSLSRPDLEKVLIFVTGGDVVPDQIKLEFSDQVPRAPRSRTCTSTFYLSTDYSTYNELAEEFNNVLNSPETFRFYTV